MADKKELKKRLDRLTSIIVRHLNDRCVTCGKKLTYKQRQAGHYIPRVVVATRWDLRNVNVQCAKCNVELEGNLPKYADYIEQRYGEYVKSLFDFIYTAYKGGKLKEMPAEKIKDIYNDYLRAVRELEDEHGSLAPSSWDFEK